MINVYTMILQTLKNQLFQHKTNKNFQTTDLRNISGNLTRFYRSMGKTMPLNCLEEFEDISYYSDYWVCEETQRKFTPSAVAHMSAHIAKLGYTIKDYLTKYPAMQEVLKTALKNEELKDSRNVVDGNGFISPFTGEFFKNKLHHNHLREHGYEYVEDFLKAYPRKDNWGYKSTTSNYKKADHKTITIHRNSDKTIDLDKTLKDALSKKSARYLSEKFLTKEICKLIEDRTKFLPNGTLSERIYYIVNNLNELICCGVCEKAFRPKFREFDLNVNAFQEQTCSTECSGKKSMDNRFIPTQKQVEKCRDLFGDISKWTDSQIVHVADKHDKKVTCAIEGCENVPNYKYKGEFGKFCSNACLMKDNIKYDTNNHFSTTESKQKIKDYYLTKYGVDSYTKTEEYKQRCLIKHTEKLIKCSEEIGVCLLSEVIENKTFHADWECNTCKHHFKARWYAKSQLPLCPMCHKNDSSLELKIEKYLKDNNVNYSKKCWHILECYELDFYIEDKALAIECHGLYYHTEKHMGKTRHQEKADMCSARGIRLIQIFQDELVSKWEIVKSRLNSILGISNYRIGANKCEIKRVNSVDAEKFLNDNHTQGNAVSTIRYGLYDDNDLVSLMTFSPPRLGVGGKKKSYDYELVRFCNKINHTVMGGASKLLTHFIKNEGFGKTILSYADKRWSDGNLYKMLGFDYIRDTDPNYWYVKGNKRYHRFNFTKQRIKEKFENYDEQKTEKVMMEENKYLRLWDAGSKVYMLTTE